MAVSVSEATEAGGELVDAFARLIPQLSRSNPPPTQAELDDIIRSQASRLLVAREGAGAIVGSLTLVLFRVPTGIRAWIEDVVVDEGARGHGVGEALNREALRVTSRPAREAANRLYQRLGFKQRDTNVYRIDLGG